MRLRRIIRAFTLLAILFCLFPLQVSAAEIVDRGSCGVYGDNLTWTLDNDGLLIISGTGDMEDYTYTVEECTSPWSYTSMHEVIIEEGVTSIGANAFIWQTELVEVTISGTVTSIGESAFSACFNLDKVVFQGSAPINESMGPVFDYEVTVYYPADNETWTKDVMQNYGESITWVAYQTTPETPTVSNVNRIYGANRYKTGFAVADQLKKTMGVEKFNTVVVACGTNFADALAGSYLAAQKNAPILLVNKDTIYDVKDYIVSNLTSGGTVYLLGGSAAVPAEMETALAGLNVKRLAGANRYATNLLILAEAGTSGQEILVCTGNGFADSLSASAVNKPILLVNKKLDNDQKAFLQNSSGKFIIIGGKGAVSAELEEELKNYGSVERIGGATRYETSINVASRFFANPESVVLAYAYNFPDGLCGGPLAVCASSPLILTATGQESAAATYAHTNGIKSGYILGGKSLISDDAASKIFG